MRISSILIALFVMTLALACDRNDDASDTMNEGAQSFSDAAGELASDVEEAAEEAAEEVEEGAEEAGDAIEDALD